MSTVRERLERCLGEDAVSDAEEAGVLAGLPLATPGDEEALCEVLALAARERLALVPIGLGTKLAWTRPPVRADLVLSTERLAGVVAYEPGDGTLTARAGTRMADLVRTASAGGHHVTPDVACPESATVGGVLAASQSGADRTRHGPARNHVLGMRVALADGSTAKTGGRLVKNVTGFDLHRLYCGSHGSLCVILEATLRLFALPASTVAIVKREPDVAAGLADARAIAGLPVKPYALVLDGARDLELVLVLAGREEVVRWERERALAAIGPADAIEGDAARERAHALRDGEQAPDGWPDLAIGCRPSQVEETVARIRDRARRIRIQPLVATVDAWLAARAGPVRERHAEPASIPPAGLALMRRIQASLDPTGVLARGRLHPGL